MYEYGIGGQEVPLDASESIADIPMNRTLMIEKFTIDPPLDPTIVGLTSNDAAEISKNIKREGETYDYGEKNKKYKRKLKKLTTVEDVFQEYQPHVDVNFQKEDGSSLNETLRFGNLGDFGTKGITNQSTLLRDLLHQKEDYAKLIKQLKSNKLLKTAIETPENKQAFISALQALLQEIEDAK
ncbi:MAG TPA: type VI secretion system contractile sheath small subunit [Chitinophagales bacterium]|nr:type VI secretion system contractile sheath small subunit [Chitinophagales bacterium]